MIEEFTGKYAFLSNFYPLPMASEAEIYPTLEHAYQAAKTFDTAQKQKIKEATTPGRARRLGYKATIREDWECAKIDVMRALIWTKFLDQGLRLRLLETGDQELVEGNNWGDRFWGRCEGEGQNWLGKLLMERRQDVQVY